MYGHFITIQVEKVNVMFTVLQEHLSLSTCNRYFLVPTASTVCLRSICLSVVFLRSNCQSVVFRCTLLTGVW